MILPNNRRGFSRNKPRKISPLVVIIILAAAAILMVIFFLSKGIFQSAKDDSTVEGDQSILELWENRQYEEINELCEVVLKDNPMYYEALVFNGFSYFYRGAAMFSLEDKIPMFDKAILNLRKAMLHKDNQLRGKVEYVLGKSYYQKGKYFTDLAIQYLESSMESGYTGDDTFEYLALAFSGLGEFQKSADYYLRAIERNPSDTLFMVLAQTYYKMDDIAKAEEYLHWTLNRTTDFTIEQKSRYLLGRIYLDQGDYLKAQDQYTRILEKDESAADAHYYLGVIYEEMKDVTKARYEWRKALEIDPVPLRSKT